MPAPAPDRVPERDAPPPVFGSWKRLYVATLALLALWILLFSAFTSRYHQPL